MISRLVSCSDIDANTHADDSISVVGQVAENHRYIRNDLFYVNREDVDPQHVGRLDEIYCQMAADGKTINLYELPGGIMYGQGTVVSANGSLIKDSALEFINHQLPPDGSYYQNGNLIIENSPAVKLGGTSLLVKRPWYRNYGHWLVDLLPLLPLTQAFGAKIDNIIYGNVPEGPVRFMMEKAADYFYPGANLIYTNDSDVVQADKLYYVRPVHVPPLFKHPVAINESVKAVKTLFLTGMRPKSDRIYVSRGQVGNRKVHNEEEFASYLTSKGFIVVYPENLTIFEQVSLFSNAKIVIGAKGAALTSCMFCEEDSHIIALTPAKFTDPFFWDLATQRMLNYSELYCKEIGKTDVSGRPNEDILVDMDKIRSLIDRII